MAGVNSETDEVIKVWLSEHPTAMLYLIANKDGQKRRRSLTVSTISGFRPLTFF